MYAGRAEAAKLKGLLVPGIIAIDFGSACTLLAEIGPDLDAFREWRHLGAWAGVAPGNNTSAGKRRSGVEYTELHPDGVGALFKDGSFLIEVRDESPELITAGDRYRRIWLVGDVVDGHATWQRPGAPC